MQVYACAMGLLVAPRRLLPMPTQGMPLVEIFLRSIEAPVTPEACRGLNTAFILCADHELSPATLSARVAASSGCELRSCLLAAMATHAGALLGGGCDLSEALLRSAGNTDQMYELMAQAEQSGGRIPGYNIKAYPRGDPRARRLLELAASLSPQAGVIVELVAGVESRFDLQPSLEVGLVALSIALKLPPRMASTIWALARVAGWVAHVIEQRQAGFMVRPRARYVGPLAG
jgi:citrate synthase